MAERTVDPIVVPFTVTTPASTAIANPQFTAVDLPPGRLVSVELQIPPGHAGTTGFRLEVAQQQILPFSTAPTWILGDDYVHEFDMDFEVGTGVRCATYNIGNYPHTHYLRLGIRRLAQPTVKTVPKLVAITAKAAS